MGGDDEILSAAERPPRLVVNEAACIRCATCATVAPGLFRLGPAAAFPVRLPDSAEEAHLARAAMLLCPTSAIIAERAARPADEALPPAPPSTTNPALLAERPVPLDEPFAYHAFLEAETARWRMADFPLDQLEPSLATPGLRRLVREAALSELTTFTASRRFLQEFSDDADLSQWIAVWLYEESRHPQVLIRWLTALGERVGSDEIVRSRATAPFIRSRMGTLVMNVISEVIAASRYLALMRSRKEPALTRIAGWLAADESRHGASFYAYARRRLLGAEEPEVERLDALKVLYFWMFEGDAVQHPVNQFRARTQGDGEMGEAAEVMRAEWPPLSRRVCAIVGALIDLPMSGPEDVMAMLREQSERSRQVRMAPPLGGTPR